MARSSDLPEVGFLHIKQVHSDKQEGRKGSVCFLKNPAASNNFGLFSAQGPYFETF